MRDPGEFLKALEALQPEIRQYTEHSVEQTDPLAAYLMSQWFFVDWYFKQRDAEQLEQNNEAMITFNGKIQSLAKDIAEIKSIREVIIHNLASEGGQIAYQSAQEAVRDEVGVLSKNMKIYNILHIVLSLILMSLLIFLLLK